MKSTIKRIIKDNSRREFIKVGGMAAMGTLLPLSHSFAIEPQAKKLRIGIPAVLHVPQGMSNYRL